MYTYNYAYPCMANASGAMQSRARRFDILACQTYRILSQHDALLSDDHTWMQQTSHIVCHHTPRAICRNRIVAHRQLAHIRVVQPLPTLFHPKGPVHTLFRFPPGSLSQATPFHLCRHRLNGHLTQRVPSCLFLAGSFRMCSNCEVMKVIKL